MLVPAVMVVMNVVYALAAYPAADLSIECIGDLLDVHIDTFESTRLANDADALAGATP